MSMNNPNPDDREQLHSEQTTDDNTIDLENDGEEDIQDSTEKRPAIVLPPGKSPTPSLTSSKQADKSGSNGQNQQDNEAHKADNAHKTALPQELVPFAPDTVQQSTQLLPPNRDSTQHHASRGLQKGQRNLSEQPTRAVVPGTFVGAAVRTPATVAVYRAQRHKKLLLRHISRKHIRLGRVEEQRGDNRFWGSIFTTIALLIILFVGVAGGGTYAAYSFYTATQSQYNAKVLDLHSLMPGDNLKMYDRNNILIAQDTSEGIKTEVPLTEISPLLKKATIDTEDKTFYSNPGIDITRIIQSALDDLRSNRVVAGGSTITQQLVKNLVLGQDQTVQRKLAEIALVPDVNSHYTKDDILTMYLNSNFYSEGAYGIDAAATVYFNLQDQGNTSAASQLDLAQAAILAGIPNEPAADDPLKHPQAAFTRFKIVLDAMLNNGDITRVQEMDAINEEQQPGFFKDPTSYTDRAPHFYYFILQELEQQYNLTEQKLAMSDMKVYTTLDINLQDQIQKIAQQQVAALVGSNATNAAEVLIDFHTGAILTLLGSIDYYNSAIDGQYDVATQAYRQPGSSFKPYVYVTAFEDGMSPGSGISDQPISIPQVGSAPFTPTDADNQNHGQMTIRCALQNSKNIPAVRALQGVGIDNAMQTAKNMGLASTEGYAGYSLVLGGLGVHLIDHTSAYGTFANGGVHVPYYGVQKVVFASTGKTDEHKQDPGTRAISPQMAYMITNVLSDNNARLPEFFRCNLLQLYSNSQNQCFAGSPGDVRPAAAKTGTTNDFRDNWTMGYTNDYVLGVWLGNDNNTPMNVLYGVTGAAPIWHDAMLAAEAGHPITDFTNPGGLQTATVTYPDGVRSTDLYLASANPNQAASNPMNQVLAPKGANGGQGHYCPNS
jgi:membrane peptidoglycan carboxypeptidase